MYAIVSRNHLPFFKIFSNFVIFAQIFKILPFFPFSEKLPPYLPLLSRLGPVVFLNVIFWEKQSQNYPTMKEGVWRHCELCSESMGDPCWGFRR